MTFLDLLAFKKMTIYRLSQLSGIPKTTLTDLGSGKTSLLDASGKTLLGISKALKVRIEELLELEPEEDMKKLPPYLAEPSPNIENRSGATACIWIATRWNSIAI